MRVVVLAGGVGAAKFLQGLQKAVSPRDLSCVVNTGDDIVLHGLHISPDLDIVTYTLAGVVDYEKGWGIHGDTFHCLESLKSLGSEEWFGLGDKDLATHLRRTELLSSGLSLSEVTTILCQRFGVESRVLPMTNDRFETWIGTDAGWMHFEEYYVRRAFRDKVTGLELRGVDSARPAPGVVETLKFLRKKGMKLGIVTRNCEDAVRKVFPDIDQFCDVFISRNSTKKVKPHPDHLTSVMKILDISGEEAVMMGDHTTDIQAGKRVGMRTIGVLTGRKTREELEQAGADYVLGEVTEVCRLFEEEDPR